MSLISEKNVFILSTAAAATLTGLAVRQLVESGWTRMHGEDEPANPAGDEVTWGEALAFAAVSGVLVAVARVVARRATTAGFRRALGRDPDGLP